MSKKHSLLRSRTLLASLGLFLGLVSTGCATSKALREALDDRDRQLSEEREAHADTYRRLQDALAREQELESRTIAASAPIVEEPGAPIYPELDRLGVSTDLRNGQVVITLPSSISFPSGKADLSKSGREALNAVSRRLKDEYTGAVFHVEGHTDSDPISKSAFPSNRELSLARALAVHAYLVDECSVPDDRFVIVGHGQYKPQASNKTAEGKAQNRRVEIVVHSGS